MQLNCDLGESFGQWQLSDEAQVMPYIDMANVACGFHAGDPITISKTLNLAKQHDVCVGAHPAYPDLAGFGRRSMAIALPDVAPLLHYQIAALEGMAKCQGLTLRFVKPHGALYNDMMANPELLTAIMQAVADYPSDLQLMIMSTTHHAEHSKQALYIGVPLLFEVFADRAYSDNGLLMPRTQEGALLSEDEMLDQVTNMIHKKTITTHGGQILSLPMDSLCVHGDNPTAIKQIQKIRALVNDET